MDRPHGAWLRCPSSSTVGLWWWLVSSSAASCHSNRVDGDGSPPHRLSCPGAHLREREDLMRKRHWMLSALLGASALVSASALAGEIANYSPVTAQRLANPEPGNWMLYRRTYDGQGYSPLDKINAQNVKNLEPVWTFSTGVNEGHEAPPIVNNGVMFIATPQAQVIALNAKTGEEIWRYKKELPEDLFQLHPTSRGVGLWQDKLFLATTDDHLVALDAKTGKVAWDQKVQDYKKGQYLTLMPLVVNGKVIVGGSGGEYGIRGYVVAYDANDGQGHLPRVRLRVWHPRLCRGLRRQRRQVVVSLLQHAGTRRAWT